MNFHIKVHKRMSTIIIKLWFSKYTQKGTQNAHIKTRLHQSKNRPLYIPFINSTRKIDHSFGMNTLRAHTGIKIEQSCQLLFTLVCYEFRAAESDIENELLLCTSKHEIYTNVNKNWHYSALSICERRVLAERILNSTCWVDGLLTSADVSWVPDIALYICICWLIGLQIIDAKYGVIVLLKLFEEACNPRMYSWFPLLVALCSRLRIDFNEESEKKIYLICIN